MVRSRSLSPWERAGVRGIAGDQLITDPPAEAAREKRLGVVAKPSPRPSLQGRGRFAEAAREKQLGIVAKPSPRPSLQGRGRFFNKRSAFQFGFRTKVPGKYFSRIF